MFQSKTTGTVSVFQGLSSQLWIGPGAPTNPANVDLRGGNGNVSVYTQGTGDAILAAYGTGNVILNSAAEVNITAPSGVDVDGALESNGTISANNFDITGANNTIMFPSRTAGTISLFQEITSTLWIGPNPPSSPANVILRGGNGNVSVLTGGSGNVNLNAAGSGDVTLQAAGSGDVKCLDTFHAESGITFDGGTNVLDFYETGEFTPALQDSSGNSFAMAGVNDNVGLYTRIGNTVFLNISLLWTGPGSTVGTDQIRITNLPYAAKSIPGKNFDYGLTIADQQAIEGTVDAVPTFVVPQGETYAVGLLTLIRVTGNSQSDWEANQVNMLGLRFMTVTGHYLV